MERPETYPIEICEIIFKADEKSYTRSLKNDFHLAPCVYKLEKVNTLPHKLNHTSLFGIDIQSGSIACVGDSVSGSFRIERIEFFKAPFLSKFISAISYKTIIAVFCLLLFIIYISVILLVILFKMSGRQHQTIHHPEIDQIKQAIRNNCHDVSLNTEKIAKKLNVSDKELALLIKEKNGTSIEDLIHQIRIDVEVEQNLTNVVLPDYKPMHKYIPVTDEDTEYILNLFRKSFNHPVNIKDIKSKIKPEINEEMAEKLLRNFMGLSINDYLKTIRVKVAEKIIEDDPSILLKIVTDKVGFNDQSLLTRAFESVEKMSPAAFQNKCKKKETSFSDLPETMNN